MIFSSLRFLLLFLPIFFLLYGITPGKYKNITLLIGSLVFYALGDPKYLLILLLSVIVNYGIGLFLRNGKSTSDEKENTDGADAKPVGAGIWLLVLAAAGNAGLLLWCKSGLHGMTFPLGMSFYTFQILSYLIDVYRGDIRAERSFVRFAVYVTMFPRVVSGPIVGYGEVAEDLGDRKVTIEKIQSGLKLFTLGLGAKVLLADRVGLLWHEVQVAGFESISAPLAWIAAIAYSLKIYFDFGGYSLMAIGLGRMLGFALPENFRTPYMAGSVREFYRRWHITLGRWFARYVYIPLGGSRGGELRTVCNLLAVWTLTALWHGFTINFLFWGLLLCALIILERQIGRIAGRRPAREGSARSKLRGLSRLYLWIVIPVTWMCFAIPDTGQLRIFLGRMFGEAPQAVVRRMDWLYALRDYGILLATSAFGCTSLVRKCYDKWKDSLWMTVLLAAVFWCCVWRIMVQGDNPFMYLNF